MIMSLEELWFQTSDMNTQKSVGGGGGGSDQPCRATLGPPRDDKLSIRRRPEKSEERTERVSSNQTERGKKHENKRSLTRALSKPPFFDAQLIYFIH